MRLERLSDCPLTDCSVALFCVLCTQCTAAFLGDAKEVAIFINSTEENERREGRVELVGSDAAESLQKGIDRGRCANVA
jgi:hypothetical protein